jgi:putative transposase
MKPTSKIKNINDIHRTLQINKMSKNVLTYNNDIWCPTNDLTTKHFYLNSWFNIKEFKSPNIVHFKNNNLTTNKPEQINFSSKCIILKLTPKQKIIINEWLNTYLKMYNIALKYIKNNIKTDKNVLNFIYLRNKLKIKKQELLKNSSIKVHDVDYAIKLVCQNYKSALSNYKAGNIKHFRVRYWKTYKNIKIMDLEKVNFSKKGIRCQILGEVKGYYNGQPYNFGGITKDCKLQKVNNEYYLYVPTKIKKEGLTKKENKVITIDPGIRRFGTGITENKIIKIGEGCGKEIERYLKRKDKIMENELIDKKVKKKNEQMINKKIKNLVNELHWQTINYLTKKCETILIGDMSSKSIVSKTRKLNKMTKRIALSLKFYEFRERLKYKCSIKGIKYGDVNEWMTSKMCSKCGNIKENLGGNEIYRCNKCGICMERDINGARNIYIKAIK